ncbi:hypothetical protein G0Q06_09940 [Puniceicoccales bacterium CK1056]|uniref:Uncharacterized protein n=1 Tax=Oceanipulchritudo coccoides TaxID=2706888 RepID=A0A6B2M199_9BACT|nr:hypothetical protein [Oceanipulchritudo coccoides]NDV62771.1 hypothetical protein [Oceanipulchritudo coccoides]
MNSLTEDQILVSIPTRNLLRFIARRTGQPDPVRHLLSLLQINPANPPDWHRILRQGLQGHLHINLGIPGIEIPEHPIEENPAALYAALVLRIQVIPVILSGEIDIACEEALISENALSKLRKIIRALD